MNTWQVTVTDTFDGEANYTWVGRYTFHAPKDASVLTIMRLAKANAGLSGVSGKTHNLGDTLEFRPFEANVIMFVTLKEGQVPVRNRQSLHCLSL